MQPVIDFLIANWSSYFIPLVVFLFSLIALFWIRSATLSALEKWLKKIAWQADVMLLRSIKNPASILCLIVSAYLGLAVSDVSETWKNILAKILWTLFVVALASGLINLAQGLLDYYGKKIKMPRQGSRISANIARVVFLVIAALAILDIWGVTTSPLLLLIAIVVAIAIIGFRDAAPNFFASFQLAATQDIKVGNYLKLESGEEGYVSNIGWNNTQLQSVDNSTIYIPNSQLIRTKIINYGQPLKRAREPFHFVTRAHMSELTGLKANNLQTLVTLLKNASDPIIYYHSHHFLEERQYLVPELSNDFAVWVNDALGYEKLAEKLASVSAFGFNNLGAFRDGVVSTIEDYMSQNSFTREAIEGREFHFIKSISVIMSTPYSARDLREFIEATRKISLSSIYFHIFEARWRLGKESNDFAIWLEDSMGEPELSREIANIDPYTYTLEGLRSLLIQVIEKRIK